MSSFEAFYSAHQEISKDELIAKIRVAQASFKYSPLLGDGEMSEDCSIGDAIKTGDGNSLLDIPPGSPVPSSCPACEVKPDVVAG